ncbi:SAM-dependent DNA methyltransferase, partial [bacterium]|nr:SAM-dependent DNA methyltransferase [bacterium]
KGKVQLIQATENFAKMRKSLGSKRNYLTEEHISEIVRHYGAFEPGESMKIFDTVDFGFRRITVERPLRLNFNVDEERIAKLRLQSKAYKNYAKKLSEKMSFEQFLD